MPPRETEPSIAQPVDEHELGDFTTDRRVLLLSAIALGIGALAAVVAVGLLDLIALCTNLFFFQRWSIQPASPAAHQLGAWVVLVPVAGATIVGLMARYGSERIRGHGIPEAIESILINGSRVAPRVALLKPLSAAISIGSGGPFGAEGPIIMTGGAFGSLVAQACHLTSAERKTLLVAGAAAGMSATFASPLAAVLLAVELLLFEWKPRSVIPVALASAIAAILRRPLLGAGPIFAVTLHHPTLSAAVVLGCVIAGVGAGALSALLTRGVYAAEDLFQRLPVPLDVVAAAWRSRDWARRPGVSAGPWRRLRHDRVDSAGRRRAATSCSASCWSSRSSGSSRSDRARRAACSRRSS